MRANREKSPKSRNSNRFNAAKQDLRSSNTIAKIGKIKIKRRVSNDKD